jgi:multidrug transporter EmrE-like cation transporter
MLYNSSYMNAQSALLLLVLAISISECLGQSCLKTYHKSPEKTHLYIAGVLFYTIVCALLVMSYKYKGMGLVNVLWSGLSVLVILSTGMLFFGEDITRMDMIGAAMIVAGIGFVVWE